MDYLFSEKLLCLGLKSGLYTYILAIWDLYGDAWAVNHDGLISYSTMRSSTITNHRLKFTVWLLINELGLKRFSRAGRVGRKHSRHVHFATRKHRQQYVHTEIKYTPASPITWKIQTS